MGDKHGTAVWLRRRTKLNIVFMFFVFLLIYRRFDAKADERLRNTELSLIVTFVMLLCINHLTFARPRGVWCDLLGWISTYKADSACSSNDLLRMFYPHVLFLSIEKIWVTWAPVTGIENWLRGTFRYFQINPKRLFVKPVFQVKKTRLFSFCFQKIKKFARDFRTNF